MYKKTLSVIAALFLAITMTYAQGVSEKIMPLNIGISAAGNLNMLTQDMNIDEMYPITENALGYGVSAGAIFNIPLTRSLFISAYAGYHGMFATSDVDNVVDGENGAVGASLKSTIHYIEISPALRYYGLFKSAERFYLTVGGEVSIPLSSKIEWQNVEVPQNTDVTTELPEVDFRPAVTLGMGYSFKVSEKSYLTPELTFRFPFTEVSKDANYQSWTVPQVRLALAWTFSLAKDEPKPEPGKPAPELKTGFKKINFYKNDGTENPLEKVKLEEVQYEELFPMLPYVFCNENENTPAATSQSLAAKNPAGEFKVADLPANAMDINKSTLDIIAVRMKDNKNARLTINGTKDVKLEGKNANVDKERADWAKNYIVSNYDIAADRITAKGIGEPTKPSTSKVEDGQAENRRLELYSDNPALLSPIKIQKEKKRIAEPAYIEFVPYAISNEEIVEWRFEIMQGGKILRKHSGSGEPDSILWNIFPNELAASEIPVDYRFSAKSVSGLEKYSDGSIPVEYFSYNKRLTQKKADSTISKFSLVVFDFDSPDISASDQNILLQNVLPAITHKSVVKIYGYSDRIGEEKYNKNLALNRAENARKLLQAKANNARYEVYGVGENIEIFDNNSPVGRQLSRTVQIYVITAD